MRCLYDWETVKKIVPNGWHIPLSDDERDTEIELFKDLGSEKNIDEVRSKFFSALNMYPIGYMSQGKYLGFGEIASYWMYMHDKITPGEFTLDRIYMQADIVENPKQIANAVRFVKDFNISIKNTGNAVQIDTVYN